MPTEQEVVEYLTEHGIPKDYRDNLRDQFESFKTEAKDWKAKAELYEQAQRQPLITKALEEHASVDVSKIAPKVLQAIQNELGDQEPSPEWATQMATDYGLTTTAGSQTPSQQGPTAQGITQQVTSSAGVADDRSAFYAELEAAPDREAARAVLAKYGQLEESA